MPLSSHEQRIFDEMEQSLLKDKKTASTFSKLSGIKDHHPTRIVLSVLTVLVGIIGLVLGVALQIPVVGVFGFAIMFVGIYLATINYPNEHKR